MSNVTRDQHASIHGSPSVNRLLERGVRLRLRGHGPDEWLRIEHECRNSQHRRLACTFHTSDFNGSSAEKRMHAFECQCAEHQRDEKERLDYKRREKCDDDVDGSAVIENNLDDAASIESVEILTESVVCGDGCD